jgi:hypothetical protein
MYWKDKPIYSLKRYTVHSLIYTVHNLGTQSDHTLVTN